MMGGPSPMNIELPYKSAVKIGPARIGICTNHPAHIPEFTSTIEVKSLLTDFHKTEIIPYSPDMDGFIHIQESQDTPECLLSGNILLLRGPLLELADKALDLRYSLWGNLGLLYHYTLYLLESCHRIYSFHACALYAPHSKILYVIAGGAGSGKTVYLLSGLLQGLKLFSTETVHLDTRNQEFGWLMGSLVDNVRMGTLAYDFPQFMPESELPSPNQIWQKKIALDLSVYQYEQEVIQDAASIRLLFPHLERGRSEFLMAPMSQPNQAAKRLFDNISEKRAQSFVLYDRIAVAGFDTPASAQKRLDALYRFVRDPHVDLIASVFADPQHCWGKLLNTT